MKRNKVLIIGSVAIDSVITPFGRRESVLGGSATYSSISASFFNRNIGIVSVVGKDFPGKYLSLLRSKGVNLKGLEISGGKTFRWKGDYNYDLSSPATIYTHLNAFADFKPRVPGDMRDSEFLFLANIDPDLQGDVLSQVKGPRLVLCDTMNFWIERKRKSLLKLLKKVDMFLLNEGEARQLSGETNIKKAALFIMSRGTPAVIIKKGEHGVLLFSRNFCFAAPAYLLETIYDPTGAGDTFAGGMLGYLSRCGKINAASIKKSLVYGSIMASFAVEDFSVDRLNRLTKRDITRRYNEFKRITVF